MLSATAVRPKCAAPSMIARETGSAIRLDIASSRTRPTATSTG